MGFHGELLCSARRREYCAPKRTSIRPAVLISLLTKSLECRAGKSIRGVIGFVRTVEAGSFAGAAKRSALRRSLSARTCSGWNGSSACGCCRGRRAS